MVQPKTKTDLVKPSQRNTTPSNQNDRTVYNGIVGLTSRRTADGVGANIFDKGAISGKGSSRYQYNPLLGLTSLRMITHLHEIFPAVGYSVDMNLRLAIPPGGLRIVGGTYKPGEKGKMQFEQSDVATAMLDELWDSLPDEIGGLEGLQISGMLTTMMAGMSVAEAVPSTRKLGGVARVWPVDPLTLEFARPNANSDFVPYQRQPYGSSRTNKWLGDLRPINSKRLHWRALDPWVDFAHGTPMYGTALPEALVQLSMVQDVRDSVHANAWPRKAWGYNFKNAAEVARTYMNLTPEEAVDFIWDQYTKLKETIQAQEPDEDCIYDSEGNVVMMPGGDFSTLPAVLDYVQRNFLWAMKEVGAMMGLGDSNADSHNTVTYSLKAARIESLRGIANSPYVAISNQHFQWKGTNYKAVAIYDKLRVGDELIAAQTDESKTRTEILKRDEGIQSPDAAAIKLTGSTADRAVPPPWERPKNKALGDPSKPAGNVQGQTTADQTASRNANKGKDKSK